MVSLGNRHYRGPKEREAYESSVTARYQRLLRKNHFLYFGLPFLISIVAGSLYLQKFTTVKWERYDHKYQQLGEEEMMKMIEKKRPVNKKNDYYRLQGLLKDEDMPQEDYEMVRVSRKEEEEPVWDNGNNK